MANLFQLAAKFGTLKNELVAEEPKVQAFFTKAEATLTPLIEAVVADLVAKGTLTTAQVAEVHALEAEASTLIAELGPILADIAK